MYEGLATITRSPRLKVNAARQIQSALGAVGDEHIVHADLDAVFANIIDDGLAHVGQAHKRPVLHGFGDAIAGRGSRFAHHVRKAGRIGQTARQNRRPRRMVIDRIADGFGAAREAPPKIWMARDVLGHWRAFPSGRFDLYQI